MEKEIKIDGKLVAFRATAAVPRLYRIKFGRDIMRDLNQLKKKLEKAKTEDAQLDTIDLELFENIAFIMARHADPENVPKTADEWLEGFETFSIYEVFPQIIELWEGNTRTLEETKKKSVRRNAK